MRILLIEEDEEERSAAENSIRSVRPDAEIYSAKDNEEAIRHLRESTRKRVRVVTFGYFSVFIDGKPAQFRYSKTEELFAILIDRKGEPISMEQAGRLLWEDDGSTSRHSSYVSSLKKDMIQTFRSAGIRRLFRQDDNGIAVVPELIECDYFDYLDEKAGAQPFKDRYMERFPWAESTIGFLSSTARKREER